MLVSEIMQIAARV